MLHPRDGLAGGLHRPELFWDVTGRRQLAKGGDACAAAAGGGGGGGGGGGEE